MAERRSLAVSTGSVSQYLSTNALKSRLRCDSCSGQPSNFQTYAIASTNGSDKILYSSTYSYQQQAQIPRLHYKIHADKIVYVTKAVTNAAPANRNIGISRNNSLASPKYGRLKPLAVDTSINESYYYIPYTTIRTTHWTPIKVNQTSSHQHQHQHQHVATKTLGTDDEDDIAGQYATLLILSDTHYTEILCRKPSAPLPLTERNHFQPKDINVVKKNQGLGDYWITNENNERVWFSVDNR